MDALVLKGLAIVLTEYLQPHLSTRCFHLAGTGGLKGAVRAVASQVAGHTFVFRTDVKSRDGPRNSDRVLSYTICPKEGHDYE